MYGEASLPELATALSEDLTESTTALGTDYRYIGSEAVASSGRLGSAQRVAVKPVTRKCSCIFSPTKEEQETFGVQGKVSAILIIDPLTLPSNFDVATGKISISTFNVEKMYSILSYQILDGVEVPGPDGIVRVGLAAIGVQAI